MTYGFRNNLLLWLSNLKGNPAVTEKERQVTDINNMSFSFYQMYDGGRLEGVLG